MDAMDKCITAYCLVYHSATIAQKPVLDEINAASSCAIQFYAIVARYKL